VLNRLDKIDQRLETLEQNTAAEFKVVRDEIAQGRQETAAEFKAVRGEMRRGLDAVRGEMGQGLDAVRGEMGRGLDVVRGEMGRGLDAVRGEMGQGLDAVRGEMGQGFDAVRGEMGQGFDTLRQDFKVELKHVSDVAYEHYLRIESEAKARAEHYQQSLNNLQTGQDAAARDYDEYWRDRNLRKLAFDELQQDVEELKKRDMEKAAAIEKIQKEIDKSKAA
jgi:hypothetical protein